MRIRLGRGMLEAAKMFGIDLAEKLSEVRDVKGLSELVINLKGEVKRKFRELAKKIHPDVKGDHDKMVRLIKAREFLMKAKMERAEPIPVRTRVFVNMGFGWASTSSYEATTTAGTNFAAYYTTWI